MSNLDFYLWLNLAQNVTFYIVIISSILTTSKLSNSPRVICPASVSVPVFSDWVLKRTVKDWSRLVLDWPQQVAKTGPPMAYFGTHTTEINNIYNSC